MQCAGPWKTRRIIPQHSVVAKSQWNDWADESLLPRHDHMRPTQKLLIAKVARAKHANDVARRNRVEMDLAVSVMQQRIELLMSWLERHDSHSF